MECPFKCHGGSIPVFGELFRSLSCCSSIALHNAGQCVLQIRQTATPGMPLPARRSSSPAQGLIRLLCALSGHKEGSRAFARYREIDKDIKRDALKVFEAI